MTHRWCISLLAALTLIGLFGACAGPPGRRSVVSELDAGDRAKASEAYALLLQTESAGNARATYDVGLALINGYPGAESEAHALLITARAARRTGDRRAASRLLDLLVRDHSGSEWAAEGWYELADLHGEAGHWAEEADALAWFDHYTMADDMRRDPARRRLLTLLREQLTLDEIDRLLDEHPDSALSSTGSWLAASMVYESDTDPDGAGERLEAFLRDYPRSRYVEDARALLAELARDHGHQADPGLAVGRADRIGLLAPLTGDYAALGQSLFDGALLAVEEYNRAMGTSLRLVSRDTRGDEVIAVQAARELIAQEQVISIVGALLSPTTVAVATLCEERGVPLVSPTATKETITDLGPHVFQTNLTKSLETRLLARVAVLGMLRVRFGILHPDTDEGRSIAARFTDELQRHGGRVVATASFDREITDFAAPIIRLRQSAPEALFIPATPTDMRLIAPQLIFHDLRAELFGPSSWNNSLLLREAGASMEQAVVPSDVALIPEARRQRFEDLWRRRYPHTPSSSIGMKSFMATSRIIDALDPEGMDTRQRLRERLEVGLQEGDEDGGAASSQPLRVVRASELVALPVALLPGLTAPVEGDLESLDMLDEQEPDQPGR
ncbi:hypothetical protein DRQ32_06090 [bacterium]|nr:MAG: hypothetical protein DRQ32_06090 [bacterium]